MKKLMIVDDEILVRVGMRSLLDWEAHGYTIVADASDGQQALEMIERHHPDIVFTDLEMHGMNGFDLIQTCTRKYPQVQFVVLSSYNDMDRVKRAMKLGAVDYFFKLEANPAELLQVLDEVSLQLQKAEEKGSDMILRQNIQALKRHLITKTIEQVYLSETELLEEYAKLQLQVDFGGTYLVLYLSIDNYVLMQSQQQQLEFPLVKFSMESVICEILRKNRKAEVFDYIDGDLITVIQLPKEAKPYHALSLLEKDFEAINEHAKRYLGVSVTGCVTAVSDGAGGLGAAVKAMRKRTYLRLPSENGKLHVNEENVREEIVMVKQYVQAHLHEELSVGKVARVAGMSESYFSHTFKKDVGMSFSDFLNHIRIARAMELLAGSNMRVNEVADAVGIYNTNYFSTLFRKMTGVSPGKFRVSPGNTEKDDTTV